MANLWYLATPYAKLDRNTAWAGAIENAAFLMKHGIKVFSPIGHGHPLSVAEPDLGEKDHDFWLAYDEEYLKFCKGLIVCKMVGWEDSKGVKWEIDYMRNQLKPVIYMNPGEVPNELIARS